VLQGIDLDLEAGSFVALLGPSGCGKSTLLRFISGLESPSSGSISLSAGGEALTASANAAAKLAFVFQDAQLLPWRTVIDNVALPLELQGLSRAEARRRARGPLSEVELSDVHERFPDQLSGGMRMRVSIARALVTEPELLLLDEPFAALDEPTRSALIPELAGILAADRVATVLVTHDRAEAMTLADRVAVLLAGRLRQVGDTATVFQSPVAEDVARFVGVETIVSGEVISVQDGVTLVDVAGRKLEVAAPAHPGERVRICIRPEDVTLTQAPESPVLSSARNHLAGTVSRITPSAPQVRVVVDVGFPLVAALTRRSVEELGLAEGRAVTAIFKASAVHLIRTATS